MFPLRVLRLRGECGRGGVVFERGRMASGESTVLRAGGKKSVLQIEDSVNEVLMAVTCLKQTCDRALETLGWLHESRGSADVVRHDLSWLEYAIIQFISSLATSP